MQRSVNATDGVGGTRPTCDRLLELHSEYVDGRLDALTELRVREHLAECASCARYDRVVRQAGSLMATLPDVEVSPEFSARLRERLDEPVAMGEPRGSGAQAFTAVLVAGVIAAAALGPLLRADRSAAAPHAGAPDASAQPASSAAATAHAPAAASLDMHRPTRPLFQPVATRVPAASAQAGFAPLFVPVSNVYVSPPGPYSPLVVTPPGQRSAGGAAFADLRMSR